MLPSEAELADGILRRLAPGNRDVVEMMEESEFPIDRDLTSACLLPLAPVSFQVQRRKLVQALGI